MSSFKHIPSEPVAVIIAFKRKNGPADSRSFTLPIDETYDYEKFMNRITEKFKLREPFNKYYTLEYEYNKKQQQNNRITASLRNLLILTFQS